MQPCTQGETKYYVSQRIEKSKKEAHILQIAEIDDSFNHFTWLLQEQ